MAGSSAVIAEGSKPMMRKWRLIGAAIIIAISIQPIVVSRAHAWNLLSICCKLGVDDCCDMYAHGIGEGWW